MKFLFICVMACMVSGCALIEKYNLRSTIVEYIEQNGEQKAIEYIDKLVAEGRLGVKNAEDLKAAIPQGIEKVKEILNKENEE